MGKDSPFTADQLAHITTYLPSWELSFTTKSGKELAEWKTNTATEILQSELFAGKLSSAQEDSKIGTDPAKWAQVCLRFFRKGRHAN